MSDNNKKNNIGKEFERAFTEGMENNNWSYLNDVIVKSVDNFLDGVGDRMNSAIGNVSPNAVPLSERKEDFSGNTRTAQAQRTLHAERERVRQQMEREKQERELARKARHSSAHRRQATELAFPYRDVGSAPATVKTILGGMGSGVFAVMALIGVITSGAASASFIVPVIIAGLSGCMLSSGIRQDKLSRTAARYVEIIGKRQYIDISILAASTGKSERKVVRELKKILKAGYFPQGHLDGKGRTFILTDEVFNHYLELETRPSQEIFDTTGRYEDEQEFPTLSAEESAKLSAMIREGNEYISRFHELNADIPGVEISAKLDRFEKLLREIFRSVREHPEQMSRIGELMDYYLPTAAKLVEAYREYDSVSEPGKEIEEAKQDIENTLDTINSAMSKLLNKLFKDSVLDVTTDAQVLKTVLAQKGLSGGDNNSII